VLTWMLTHTPTALFAPPAVPFLSGMPPTLSAHFMD